GVLDDPQHRKIDVDDILVAGQHQRFLRHLPRAPAPRSRLGGAVADLHPVLPGHAGRLDALDRRRQMIIEPGLGRAIVGAEAEHDADLVGQYPVEPADQPQHDDRDDRDRHTGAGTEPAREHAPEAVLAAPQKLFEIGRGGSGAARTAGAAAITAAASAAPRSPAAAAGSGSPRTAALTLPDHRGSALPRVRSPAWRR